MSEFYGGNSGNEVFRDFSPGPHGGLDTDPDAVGAPDDIDKGAKAALILGLLSLVLGIVTGLPAIWVGRKSLQHIAASEGDLRGRRLASTGMGLGCVGIILTGVVWVYLHQHPRLNSSVAVANQLGCADVQAVRNFAASNSVTCSFRGEQVIVSWFDSQTQEDAFKKANQHVKTEVVGLPITVYGDSWAISCTKATVCAAAKQAMR
ncbi:DUF4190 domain-containing protein [Nocardioides cynanchi]|uniref:DUF4190 domain-containing protein n=1 Tax=Nocardioides cynanchi TaxID=2558918 RepID=UPI00177B6FD0|nr:DUF4190 domain-containing protein [Nocardioides cynanchi]